MSNYFTEMRINWILENIRIFGRMRREFIMTKFDVSVAQASLDIREAMKRDKHFIYNKSTKQYEYEFDC